MEKIKELKKDAPTAWIARWGGRSKSQESSRCLKITWADWSEDEGDLPLLPRPNCTARAWMALESELRKRRRNNPTPEKVRLCRNRCEALCLESWEASAGLMCTAWWAVPFICRTALWSEGDESAGKWRGSMGGLCLWQKRHRLDSDPPPHTLSPKGSRNNAPTGICVSPQLRKSQERERSLLQMLDRELNRFFPKPRKKGREKGCGERGEWKGGCGKRGQGRIWTLK